MIVNWNREGRTRLGARERAIGTESAVDPLGLTPKCLIDVEDNGHRHMAARNIAIHNFDLYHTSFDSGEVGLSLFVARREGFRRLGTEQEGCDGLVGSEYRD